MMDTVWKKIRDIGKGNGLLIGIIIGGFLLRLFHLSKESLWVDEGFTYQLARLDLGQYVENVLGSLRNILPPFYFSLMHYWAGVFGSSEFSLRFPSVIFGSASILVIFLLGKTLFNRRVGLLSALILALSVFHVRYSQEARMYELLSFTALCAFYFLVSFLRVPSRKNLLLLTIANVVLAYTHHYGFFVIAAQVIYVLLAKGKWADIKRVAPSFAAVGLLIIPWMGVLLNQVSKVYKDPWLPVPGAQSVMRVFVDFSGSFLFLAVLCGCGVFFLMKNFRKHISRENPIVLLLVWLFAPFIFSLAYSYWVSPIFSAKYLIFASLPLYILAAAGIDAFKKSYQKIAIACIIVLSLFALRPYYTSVQKEQWRDAAELIESQAHSGDLVLFNAGFGLKNGFMYYAHRKDLSLKPFPARTEEINTPPTVSDVDELAGLIQGKNRVWMVFSHSADKDDVIWGALADQYGQIESAELYGIVVYLFQR